VVQRLRLNQAQAQAKAEADFNARWEAVCEGEFGIVGEVNEYLELREIESIRKKTALCKSWHNAIFDKIQVQVEKEVERRDRASEIASRWRQAKDEYISALEGKDKGLFRDIIIESEYDPLELCGRSVKYDGRGMKDPLKVCLPEAKQDEVLPGEHKPELRPAAAHDGRLPVGKWSHLEATPYGHYKRMEETQNHKAAALSAYRLRSQISMDHYHYARGPAMVDREFPKPKRTFNLRR